MNENCDNNEPRNRTKYRYDASVNGKYWAVAHVTSPNGSVQDVALARFIPNYVSKEH